MGKKKAEPGEIMGIDVRSSAGEFLSFAAASGGDGIYGSSIPTASCGKRQLVRNSYKFKPRAAAK